ncbi:efflux RND transporter permease subunit [Janthinobacterium fluminis]|uniref:Efflux RND transporter permease subunit n=1 Tax=Janthinobacterium fluminis TaxID=2987524 RepID=A0ABT5JV56_9BURK|nr:efflux RND transporter permease subunit [Janthinobacterium fluminis]MDC8756623.1 efflux RND transporter permease subunit [Janthinobacterium fluminis]
MMRWIVKTSLRLRYLVLAASVMLIVLGATQFRGMPVDVYPEFAPPKVEVQVLCLGMPAADVEALVTVPMEQALSGIPGLDVLRTRSVNDLSDVVLIFKQGANLMDARLRVQERVTAITSQLPRWATSPFMIQPLSSTSRVMKIGLSVKDKSTQNLIDAALTAYWVVRPRLMMVPGVANVAIWGDRWSVLQVHADADKMRERKVTINGVMDAAADALDVGMLKHRSGHEIGTGGFIDTPNQRLVVRHILPNLTPAELGKVPLDTPKGAAPVRLGDVATIVRDTQPHLNGDAIINDGLGLMLIVEKLAWGNTMEVTRGIEEALDKLRPGLPGIAIDTTIFRPATFIEDALGNLGGAMLIGFALIVAVLLLFLYEWRVALISVVSIPLSVVSAGLILKYMGASINTMVLAGMIIALGIIVDDAIIDVENIVRRLRQRRSEGSTESSAAIILAASLEVRAPIIHATLIIVAATVPIYLLEGLTGAFFRPMASAYALAILCSMVVALTVTPALALAALAKAPLDRPGSPLARWLRQRYERALRPILRHPAAAYGATGAFALAAILVWPLLGQGLFPAFKERDFLMHWVARPGTSHAEMLRIVQAGAAQLRAIPGVRNFGAHIGQGTLSDEPVGMNFAENWISIDKTVDYDKTLAAVQAVVDTFPGLQTDVQTYLKERTKEVLSGSGHGIVARISGEDLGIMRQKAKELQQKMSAIKGVVNAHVDLVTEVPQIQIEADLGKASRYGIKPGDLRRTASVFIASEEAGDIWHANKNIEVHVWSDARHRNSIHSVADLMLNARDGRLVRLGDLAKVEFKPVPNVVLRENGSRRIDIAADVADSGQLGAAARAVQELLATLELPRGYSVELLGEYTERENATRRLLILSVAALAAVTLLLHTAFASARLAVLVVLTLPFALAGAIVATGIGDRVLSLGTLVGFLTVLGVAARNGILMIKHFQHLERYEGETFGLALVVRGARERLSPILMTSLAAGFGVLPLVIAGTVPGNEIEHPMAVAILGGLITSTALNLFVLPSLYLRFAKPAGMAPAGLAGPA